MALDENPDEVFDNEPEGGPERNGDEQSNRSFRMMMIGLFAFGGLGVLLIALLLIGRSGERQAVDAQNLAVQATNAEVIRLSQITPTPLPTETPVPTNTAVPPTNTPTLAPSPTTAPTQSPVITETGVLTGTGALTSTTGSTTKATATPAGRATTIAQAQGTAPAGATAKPATGGQATLVPGSSAAAAATATVAASKGLTSTQSITGTTGAGGKGLPTTGANDNLFVLLLAAVGLVGVLVVARRLRTSQN